MEAFGVGSEEPGSGGARKEDGASAACADAGEPAGSGQDGGDGGEAEACADAAFVGRLRRHADAGDNSLEEGDITHGSDIDWSEWGQWLVCICVVGFDLEIGNNVEKIVPSHATLLPEDAKNISFLSFPDSNTGCTGDSKFSFRIRASNGILQRYTTTPSDHVDKRYFYGSVYFRQTPDASIRRGYYQKSIVLISTQPCVAAGGWAG